MRRLFARMVSLIVSDVGSNLRRILVGCIGFIAAMVAAALAGLATIAFAVLIGKLAPGLGRIDGAWVAGAVCGFSLFTFLLLLPPRLSRKLGDHVLRRLSQKIIAARPVEVHVFDVMTNDRKKDFLDQFNAVWSKKPHILLRCREIAADTKDDRKRFSYNSMKEQIGLLLRKENDKYTQFIRAVIFTKNDQSVVAFQDFADFVIHSNIDRRIEYSEILNELDPARFEERIRQQITREDYGKDPHIAAQIDEFALFQAATYRIDTSMAGWDWTVRQVITSMIGAREAQSVLVVSNSRKPLFLLEWRDLLQFLILDRYTRDRRKHPSDVALKLSVTQTDSGTDEDTKS